MAWAEEEEAPMKRGKSMEELKPCPFCGGEANDSKDLSEEDWIFCLDCGVGYKGENAIGQWNTRPTTDITGIVWEGECSNCEGQRKQHLMKEKPCHNCDGTGKTYGRLTAIK